MKKNKKTDKKLYIRSVKRRGLFVTKLFKKCANRVIKENDLNISELKQERTIDKANISCLTIEKNDLIKKSSCLLKSALSLLFISLLVNIIGIVNFLF